MIPPTEGGPGAAALAGASSVRIRDAQSTDIPAIAAAVADQPLLALYGVAPEGLARSLHGALSRGEDLLLAESVLPSVAEGTGSATAASLPAPSIRGMAWFLRSGTFALGGYLRLIALAPGHEGQGVGGLLLDEVERRTLTRSRCLFLIVSSSNHGARRFYLTRGYSEAGALPALLRPDLDEVIMWKRLQRTDSSGDAP